MWQSASALSHAGPKKTRDIPFTSFPPVSFLPFHFLTVSFLPPLSLSISLLSYDLSLNSSYRVWWVLWAALPVFAELQPIFNLVHFSHKSRHLVTAVLVSLVRNYSPKVFQPCTRATPRFPIPKAGSRDPPLKKRLRANVKCHIDNKNNDRWLIDWLIDTFDRRAFWIIVQ